MPEEIRPPSAEELEAADRELNTGLPIELVNVHARAVMHGITPAQYVIRVLRERRIADQEAERPERDRRIAELVKAGHYHDATGHAVRSLLDGLGAADDTDRKGGAIPEKVTTGRIRKAIAAMSVTRPGPDGLVTVSAENAAEAVMRVLGAGTD